MSNAEYSIAFTGATRQDVFDLVFPEFDGTEVKMSLDIINWTSNANPLKYEIGEDWVSVGPYEGKDSACAIFKLWGTNEENKEQMGLVKKWTLDLNLDWEKYHVAYRAMIGFDSESVRTFYYRIYRNEDFECFEHPEMLLNTPQGMYHCPVCGDMQVAGLPHLPKEAQMWSPPAGLERGVIESTFLKITDTNAADTEPYTDAEIAEIGDTDLSEYDKHTRELYHDAQLLDDADGRKIGDPESE